MANPKLTPTGGNSGLTTTTPKAPVSKKSEVSKAMPPIAGANPATAKHTNNVVTEPFYKLTLNGETYTLPELGVKWMKERYASSYDKYYTSTPEDLTRRSKGLMPAVYDRSYSSSPLDKELRQMGLPSSRLMESYMVDMAKWYGDGTSYELDDAAQQFVKSRYQKSWQYEYTAEDQARKAQGLPPLSVVSKYKDSYTDYSLSSQGLPPSSEIGKYLTDYESYITGNARISDFNRYVAAQIYGISLSGTPATEEQKKQAYYDALEDPQWSDVAALYKNIKKADSISETDYISDSGVIDTQAYRSARLKAIAEEEELKDSDTPYTTYDLFAQEYPTLERDISAMKVVSDSIPAGETYTYGQAAEEARKEKNAEPFSTLTSRPKVRGYIKELYASAPNTDPIQLLNSMYESGMNIQNVKQARNKLMDMNSGEANKAKRDAISAAYDAIYERSVAKKAEEDANSEPTFLQALGDRFAAAQMGSVAPFNAESGKAAQKLGEEASSAEAYNVKKAFTNRNNAKIVSNLIESVYNSGTFKTVSNDVAIATYKKYVKNDGGVTDAEAAEGARQALLDLGLSHAEIGIVEDAIASEGQTDAGNFLLRMLFPDEASDKAVERDVSHVYSSEAVRKRLQSKAGQGEIQDVQNILTVARQQYAEQGIMNPFQFDNAVREAGYGMALNNEESAHNYFVYGRYGVDPVQAEAEWAGLADEDRDTLVNNIMATSMQNPDFAKTTADVLAYQGATSIVPKAVAGIISGFSNAVDMTASFFSGRTDRWQVTKSIDDFCSTIQNTGRSNQNLFTQGVSLASDVGAEVVRMYLLSVAGDALSATKLGQAFATKAVAETASKGMRGLAKFSAFTLKSQPFMMNAAGNYYAEALESGASIDQARIYAVLCGGIEGYMEAFNTDKIWGRVFGSKNIAKGILSGADDTLSKALIGKAKFINLAASFFGEYTEEAAGYAVSWLAGSAQGWNEEKFSLSEMNAQGMMGGLVGILGASLQLPSMNKARILADYMVESGDYSTKNYDLLYAAFISSSMTGTARSQYLARGYDSLLSIDQHDAVVADIVSAGERQNAREKAHNENLATLKKDYTARQRSAKKALTQFTLLQESGADPASDEFIEARSELLKYGSPEEELAKYRKAKQSAIDTYERLKQEDFRAMDKASDKLRAHYAVLADVFSDEITRIATRAALGKVDLASYEEYAKSTYEMDSMVASGTFDAEKYDRAVARAGRSISVAEAVSEEGKKAPVTSEEAEKRMRAIQAGKAKEYFEAQAQQEKAAETETPKGDNVVLFNNGETPSEAQKSVKAVSLSEQDRSAVSALAQKLGKTVEWRQMDEWIDGYYEDGKIVLNTTQRVRDGQTPSMSAIHRVLVHEMTHSIEGTTEYNALASYVVNQVAKATGKSAEELYDATTQIYRQGSGGSIELTPAQARREIVARYAEENFLTNEEAINTLVREQTSAAGRFLNWVQYQIKKLGGRFSKSPETAILLTAERLYLKAFAASNKSASGFNKKYSVGLEPVELAKYNAEEGAITNGTETAGAESSGTDGRGLEATKLSSDETVRGELPEAGLLGRGNRGNASRILTQLESARPQLEALGIPNVGLEETGDHSAFVAALDLMRSENIDGGSVDPKTTADLEGSVVFMNADGTVGGAVEPSGNITAVFKNRKKNSTPSVGVDIVLTAIAHGGDRLDCYGERLANIYAIAGMVPVARVSYSREYGSPEMNAYIDAMRAAGKKGFETDPDIYFMRLASGSTYEGILNNIVTGQSKAYTRDELDALPLMEYDEAQSFRDQSIASDISATRGLAKDASYSIADGEGTPFTEMLKKYGRIDEGMEPRAREVAVPKQTGDEKYVSDFARSALESAHVTEELVPEIEQAIASGDIGVYARTSNAETLDAAQEEIARQGGILKASEYFSMAVKNGLIKPKNGAMMVAMGEQLLAEAASRRDARRIVDLVTDLCILGTELGQATQAFAMLKKLGGVGSAFYMQKMVSRLNDKYAKQIKDGKMKRIVLDTALVDALVNAQTDAEIRVAQDAIFREVGSKIPLTVGEALSNWRYFSMLANPLTHARNITGNIFSLGMRKAKDVVATGIESVAEKKGWIGSEDRTHAIYSKKAEAATVSLATKAWDKYEDDATSGGKYGFESELRKYSRQSNIELLDKMMKGNAWLLSEFEDIKLFLKPAFIDSFSQYMVAQKIDPRTMTEEQEAEAAKVAIEEARRATFRETSLLASRVQSLSDTGWFAKLVMEGVLPFKKTPINIARRGIEYSPVGIAQGVYMLKNISNGKYTASQAIDRISSGIVGSSLVALGVLLARAGLLRGRKKEDDNYEKLLVSTGEQPYSLNIGGVTVSLKNVPPATIPLFMGVMLYEQAVEGGDMTLGDVAETIAGITDPLMEMSFMASLNQALTSYNTDNSVGGAIGNFAFSAIMSYFSQYIPTFGGKVAAFADDTVRTSSASKASPVGNTIDYWARSQAKKIPFLSKLLEPAVNTLGEETTKGTFGDWAIDFANKFILPMTISVKNRDAVDEELIKVFEYTGEKDALPASPQKYLTVAGEQHPLTAKEYTEYSEEYGQAVYNALKAVIATQEYASAGYDQRSLMFKAAIEGAEKQVRNKWKVMILEGEID